ncbi:MAG: hypothetical protein V4547_08930 [Bacteroidota bacterium]
MSKNPKIKLKILTEKQLKKLTPCFGCQKPIELGKLYYYVDESNISITNNAKGICKNCKEHIEDNKEYEDTIIGSTCLTCGSVQDETNECANCFSNELDNIYE